MTPRQRVLAALNHCQPDRTPCDFWAEEPTWNRLLAHVGHDDRGRVLDDLGVDVRHLTVPGPREQVVRTGVYQNMWGERFVYKGTSWGPMREDVPGAWPGPRSLADLKAFNWPTPDVFD